MSPNIRVSIPSIYNDRFKYNKHNLYTIFTAVLIFLITLLHTSDKFILPLLDHD